MNIVLLVVCVVFVLLLVAILYLPYSRCQKRGNAPFYNIRKLLITYANVPPPRGLSLSGNGSPPTDVPRLVLGPAILHALSYLSDNVIS